MIEHFRKFAQYNQWANARLYEAALKLTDEDYRANAGVAFGSLHGTLNHVLVADRIWMRRFTGTGDDLKQLDAILFDDIGQLALARAAEDERILAFVNSCDARALAQPVSYRMTTGEPQEHLLADLLRHLFNHQTHHRGQAHACISIAGGSPPALDLLLFLRGFPAPDLAALARRPPPGAG